MPQRLKPDPLLNVNQSSEQNINPRTAREEKRKEEMKESKTLLHVAMAIILAFGLYLISPLVADSLTHDAQTEETSSEVVYQGVEGKNALELLKTSNQVETETSEFGEFVTTINGVKAGSGEFWAFYVNGKQASVGAGAYETKSGETITWKLEKIQ